MRTAALVLWTLVGSTASAQSWESTLHSSLSQVPERQAEWQKLVLGTRGEKGEALTYLLRFMPQTDLKSLPTQKVMENIDLAFKAKAAVKWGKSVPKDVFLDAVLPYASVTETRKSMRAEFFRKYEPLVAKTKTPGEAALLINQSLFKDYKVVYNTRRLRTDQSAPETISQGMATCTGLSIMLVDACRAVGVPARLAGISSWPGTGGNHTWVEVWDQGWHFVGAAEPDPKGLDNAWFVENASKAVKDKPENAIWAVSYRMTGHYWPIVWNPFAKINAENVTDRYTGKVALKQPRLMVEVKKGGERVVAQVTAYDLETGASVLSGKSFGPRADINFHVNAPVPDGHRYVVFANFQGKTVSGLAKANGDTVVHLNLAQPTDEALKAVLADRFSGDAAKSKVAASLLDRFGYSEDTAKAAYEAFRNAPIHDKVKAEYKENKVSVPDRLSPYMLKHVGTKPAKGWGLVIVMHGGGSGPKSLNDSQWSGMLTYYHDHPENGGYISLALRAPNDEWNGFYDDAICPLIEKLILQFSLCEDIDLNRVYAIGVSHGGYGAYVIGPKIPYRFAAVHASASAATDGETKGENLRNVPFTWMVGEKDTAYGRAERCQKFQVLFDGWRKQYGGGYVGGMLWKPGIGHFLPDRDQLKDLLAYPVRDTLPKHVVWTQSDDVLHRFYWLEALAPKDNGHVEAIVTGNTIKITRTADQPLALWLDPKLVNFGKPVEIEAIGAKKQSIKVKPSLATWCLGLEQTGDPQLSSPVRIEVR